MSKNEPSADQKNNDALMLIAGMAEVLESLGKPEFYFKLSKALAQFLDSGRFMTIRYARYARPEFLVNNSMSEEAVTSYLNSYYRIDPLLRMVRKETTRPVVTFDEMRRSAADTLFFDELYRTASIRDELVFLLPTIGGVYAAICMDRARRYFSPDEIRRAETIYPTLDKLHQLHTSNSLANRIGGNPDDVEIATLILDNAGHIILRNAHWNNAVSSTDEGDLLEASNKNKQGKLQLDNNTVLHWETLNHMSAIAPSGKALVLERISPGYLDLTSKDVIERFAEQHDLTPKETEIVAYTMEGQSTARIAELMKISTGTVRNHKHRLYYKLDITTERELFCSIFDAFSHQ